MELQSNAIRDGGQLDYTAGADGVTCGDVLKVGGRAAMVVRDLAANEKGYVYTEGIFKIRSAACLGNVGDNVYWDEDGDPYGGDAGIGALTTNAAAGDFWVGILVTALTTTDGEAWVELNKENPELPRFAGKTHELKSDDYTVDALDNGKVLHIATDAKTFTLPAAAAGMEFTFVNDGADAACAVTISPNAADQIDGADLDGADDKDIINTKATAVRGDYITLAGTSAGWYVKAKRGIWALAS